MTLSGGSTRSKIAGYLMSFSTNIRRELAATAERRVNGRASLYTNVGLAEHAGIDLEAAAAELSDAAASIVQGAHLDGSDSDERDLAVRYLQARGSFALLEAAALIDAGEHERVSPT